MKKLLETVTLNGLVLFHHLALSQLTLPRLTVGGLGCPVLSTINRPAALYFADVKAKTLHWGGVGTDLFSCQEQKEPRDLVHKTQPCDLRFWGWRLISCWSSCPEKSGLSEPLTFWLPGRRLMDCQAQSCLVTPPISQGSLYVRKGSNHWISKLRRGSRKTSERTEMLCSPSLTWNTE